jgi:hypothetical protein
MKEISKEQQKELDELYVKYYTYLSKWHLGHSFEELRKPKYHKDDFESCIDEEAFTIKINEGY